MDIEIKKGYAGCDLIFTADNVQIVEDIETRIYPIGQDNKKDFSKAPLRDINNEILNQFCNTLNDLIYYREREFDSSQLITELFKKLPDYHAQELLKELIADYQHEDHEQN